MKTKLLEPLRAQVDPYLGRTGRRLNLHIGSAAHTRNHLRYLTRRSIEGLKIVAEYLDNHLRRDSRDHLLNSLGQKRPYGKVDAGKLS